MYERSKRLFEMARAVIPGGVNSPVRAFKAVGGNPLFIARGRGCRVDDVDGNEYIDYVGSWGPLILGHCHPEVTEALRAVLETGTSYGAPTEREIELAQLICEAFPSVAKVRLTSSGTESTMAAVRLARGFTGRSLLLKFEGCYHGHGDSFLVKAGSGVATLGLPDSPGVPAEQANLTLTCPFNDLESVERIFEIHPGEIAAVIVEPVAGNMGCVPPVGGFLEGLRRLTQQDRCLLIFDEVMTGFRVAYGGAQTLYDVQPDITTLGKIIGGGLPVGAYGGKQEIMDQLAPNGPIYQAGTLSGNPLAVTAGVTTLKILKRPGIYEGLERRCHLLEKGISQAAHDVGLPLRVNRVGSMFTFFFSPIQAERAKSMESGSAEVRDWETARRSNTRQFSIFFREMLQRGIYLAPSQFEADFVSTAHEEGDILETITAARQSFSAVVASA